MHCSEICWQILHGGSPTTVRTFPSNARAAHLTPTLTHLLQATHGAGTTWGACRNSEVHPGQEQSQSNHYEQAKPKSAASVKKKKKNLFSLQGRQKFGSNTGQVMEGERGESGKAADFCKGVEACPSCKKGKRVWLERKAEVTGICYSYSCVKGGEGTEQSLPAS